MSILELQVLTSLILILWFDVFGLHRIILRAFGKRSWDDFKPFSCYFCTGFWIGVITAGAYWGITQDTRTAVTLIALNIVITRVLDNLLGFDSIKSK